MCILYICHNSLLLYFDNLCKYISLSDHCQLLKSYCQLYQVKNRHEPKNVLSISFYLIYENNELKNFISILKCLEFQGSLGLY